FEVIVVGTRFRVTRGPTGLRVEVAQGHVQVRAPSGRAYDVWADQTVDIESTGVAPSVIGKVDFPELDAVNAGPIDAGADAGARAEAPQAADAGVEGEEKELVSVPAG